MASRLCPFFLLLMFGWAGEAYADTTTNETRARELTATGNGHFEAGRYAEAERAFREAYALSGLPGFLWNMAQCARLSGQSERALVLYRKYLETAPEGSQREEAERWVGLLQLNEPKPATPKPSPNKGTERDTTRRNERKSSVLVLSDTPAYREDASSPAVYETWWFWAGAGAVVTGVVAAVLISNGSESSSSAAAQPGTIRW